MNTETPPAAAKTIPITALKTFLVTIQHMRRHQRNVKTRTGMEKFSAMQHAQTLEAKCDNQLASLCALIERMEASDDTS